MWWNEAASEMFWEFATLSILAQQIFQFTCVTKIICFETILLTHPSRFIIQAAHLRH